MKRSLMRAHSRRWLVLISTLLVSLTLTPEARRAADLPAVLKAASNYVLQHSKKLPVVTALEEYQQMDSSGGNTLAIKRLNDEVVLVGLGDGTNYLFRDTVAIDTKKINPARTGRLLKLFTEPGDKSLQPAQGLTEEALG